ncbi:MAG: DNA polymerase Y family protein, partial [Burkholderiales bacterium]|nr:DNA polymerase Y family protein [Burkholderiales bacterium]
PAHLQLLLRERLARVELAAPTLELRLHCKQLVRSAAPNGELFPTRQSQAQGLLRLLERLRARLGETQVLRLVPRAEHRPERAGALRPVGEGGGGGGGRPGPRPEPAAGRGTGPRSRQELQPGPADLPLARPFWLLEAPQALAEQGALPLFEGRALQLLSGPERIESGWWDGGLAARDYFIARAADGALVWIYRARLPQAGASWFLQGRFG